MRFRRILSGLGLTLAAATASLGVATAASASPGAVTTGNSPVAVAHHHPISQPPKYQDTSGKLDCTRCASVRGGTGNYQVSLTFKANRGQISPFDNSVTVTDGKGHSATLARTGAWRDTVTFAGITSFKPVAYSGLQATRGAWVGVTIACKPYVNNSGRVSPCSSCKPANKPGAQYQVTLTFWVLGGKVSPTDTAIFVGDYKGHWGVLSRSGSSTFSGKLSFVPTMYNGLEVTYGSYVAQPRVSCKVLLPKPPPCVKQCPTSTKA